MRREEMAVRIWVFEQRMKGAGLLWVASQTLNAVAEQLKPEIEALNSRDREALSWRNLEVESKKVVTTREWRVFKNKLFDQQQAERDAEGGPFEDVDEEDEEDEEILDDPGFEQEMEDEREEEEAAA